MNYKWEKNYKKGQKAIGFLEEYSSSINGIAAKALISYFPQFPDSNLERNVHVTLILAASKGEITDGMFHWIYDDISEIVKMNEADMFPESSKALEYLLTQTFLVRNMPDLQYFSHGDYGFVEK